MTGSLIFRHGRRWDWNNADLDDDNDGVADSSDPFPQDTDDDGTDNPFDPDDDNDGVYG